MAEELFKAFLTNGPGNTSLQEKLKAAAHSNAVADIVKDAGFRNSADGMKNAQSEIEITELEGAAGRGIGVSI